MRFFFYGTLLDPDVREELLGAARAREAGRPAVLNGYVRRRARRGDYPVIVPRRAHSVEGAVFDGLSLAEAACIAHFEGPDYSPETREVTIRGGTVAEPALVFLPLRRSYATSQPWSREIWGLQSKRLLLRRIRMWLRDHEVGTLSSQDISWPTRRALQRAAARSIPTRSNPARSNPTRSKTGA